MAGRAKTFIKIDGFGTLYVERTLILGQRPVCFLCSNGSCHFLFYEIERERDSTQWLVVPIKTIVAKSILKGEIPIQTPYKNRESRSSEKIFIVKKYGSFINGTIKEGKPSDLVALPKNDIYKSVC